MATRIESPGAGDRTRRILLLHASAGSGHKRAAEALAREFQTQGADATVADILDFTPALFRDTYAKGYLRVVRVAPELWGFMYAVSDRKAWVPWRRKVRSTFNAINTRSLRGFLKDVRPDAIVCTHFLPVELLSTPGFRRAWPVPRYCVVTDFAVHALWIASGADGFYVATEEARRHLLRRGIAPACIRVTGIPVDPAFGTVTPADHARSRLGLDPRLPAVLIMNGGFGQTATVDLLRSFAGAPHPFQLLVVSGASPGIRAACEAAGATLRCPVRIFGFVDHIADLMDAADIVISKPGGLTVSEVLAKGKPLVIVNPIPGQEQRNCEYLLEAGAATRLYEMADACTCVRELLGDPARLDRMRAAARRIGHPDARVAVTQDILGRLAADAAAAHAALPPRRFPSVPRIARRRTQGRSSSASRHASGPPRTDETAGSD